MTTAYVESQNVQVIDMCYRKLGWRVVKDPAAADRIFFSTGSAVWPYLYGEKKLPGTRIDIERDVLCCGLYALARALGTPMIGICRGAQFLHVSNGGKVWQSVDGHLIQEGHEVKDDDGSISRVASWHHQLMRYDPQSKGQVVSTASLASYKRTATRRHYFSDNENAFDIEVMWYEKTRSLCYQPHPEYSSGNFEHFDKMLKRFDLR